MKRLEFFLWQAKEKGASWLQFARDKIQSSKDDELKKTESIEVEVEKNLIEIIRPFSEPPTQDEIYPLLQEQLAIQNDYICFLESYFLTRPLPYDDLVSLSLEGGLLKMDAESLEAKDFIVVSDRHKTHEFLRFKIDTQKSMLEEHLRHIVAYVHFLTQKRYETISELSQEFYIDENQLLLTECLKQPHVIFKFSQGRFIESLYDKSSGVLILKGSTHSNIVLVGSLCIKYLYLQGDFTLRKVNLEIVHEICCLGRICFDETQVISKYFVSCGEKVDFSQSVLASQVLVLENHIQIQRTTLDVVYSTFRGDISLDDTVLNTKWYDGSFEKALFNRFYLSSDCAIFSGGSKQPLMFKNSVLNTRILTIKASLLMEATTLDTRQTEKSHGFLIGHSSVPGQNEILNMLYLETDSSLRVQDGSTLKVAYVDFRGHASLEDTRLVCHTLTQSGQLTLCHSDVEAKFLFKMHEKSRVFCADKVTLTAESIDISGMLTEYSPPKKIGSFFSSDDVLEKNDWEWVELDIEPPIRETKTLSLHAKKNFLIHKHAQILLKTHVLTLVVKKIDIFGQLCANSVYFNGKSFNNFGLFLAEKASVISYRACYNQGQLIVEDLCIHANFFNILGEVYAKKRLLVRQGLLDMNAGLISANNYFKENKLVRNFGMVFPHMHAEYRDLYTYKNICTIISKVAPRLVPHGKHLVRVAEKIPSMIATVTQLLSSSPTKQKTPLLESLKNLWINQVCHAEGLHCIKQLLLKELNDIYQDSRTLLMDTDDEETVRFGNEIAELVTTIQHDDVEDWLNIDFNHDLAEQYREMSSNERV